MMPFSFFYLQIYICGGFNGTECLQTCESYNPIVDEWTLLAPMSIQRSGVGVIASLTYVYAVSTNISYPHAQVCFQWFIVLRLYCDRLC